MKFFVLLVFCLCFATLAHADETLYQKAKRLFEIAEAPDLDTIQGWISGRCHKLDDENRSYGDVLIYERAAQGFGLDIFGHDGGFAETPDRYDDITDQDRAEISAMWENAKQSESLGNAEMKGNTLVTHNGAVTLEARQIARYVFVRRVEVSLPNSSENSGEIYCVFFRKIRLTK